MTLADSQSIKYWILPEHMREGMQRYIEDGIVPGDFLRLILCNDFVRAAACADNINKHYLLDYAHFIYWEIPSLAWGSEAKVQAWATAHLKPKGTQNETTPETD